MNTIRLTVFPPTRQFWPKSGRDPYEVLKEIRSIIGEDGELFVQVTAEKAEGMVEEAHKIVEVLGKTTLIKIPCVPEGFKAMKQLKKEGIRFIGTAIYTAMQGFLAAKCGAEYVAPYVNRIDNMGFDGVQVAKDIHDAITANGLDSGLLAASFKNSQQVLELTKYGVKAVTVAPDVIDGLVKNAAIDSAIAQFTNPEEENSSPEPHSEIENNATVQMYRIAAK